MGKITILYEADTKELGDVLDEATAQGDNIEPLLMAIISKLRDRRQRRSQTKVSAKPDEA